MEGNRIDNASNNGAVQALRAADVTVIESARNVGYGAACNMGVSQVEAGVPCSQTQT